MIAKPIYGRGFKGCAAYLMEGKKREIQHRIAWSESRNLGGLDPQEYWRIAARTMRATANLSGRVEKPVLHIPLSWPAEDQKYLDDDRMRDISDRLLADLELGDHQALIIAHNDTEHQHVHILVNRVHPETGKAWATSQDFQRINQSLARAEIEFGLRQVEHWGVDRLKPQGNSNLEPWDGEELAACRRKFAPAFYDASDWQDLRSRLAAGGLRLEVRGQGLIVTDGSHFMKLSQFGKSVRQSTLEKRFGASWVSNVSTFGTY